MNWKENLIILSKTSVPYICQKSLNCTFKISTFTVYKLYLSKTDLKNKIHTYMHDVFKLQTYKGIFTICIESLQQIPPFYK